MNYTTAESALRDGVIVYGQGRVEAVRRGNGFIYWPKQAAVAMDSADGNKSERTMKRANKCAEADREIARLFPMLMDMAMDDSEDEQTALFDDADYTSNRYVDDLAATREHWKSVNTRNRQRSQFPGQTGRYAPAKATAKAGKATDAVATNAKRAKGYSMFSSAAKLIKAAAQSL